MTNLDAARSGDRLQALERLRDTLAGLLDTTESQVHAQLSAQYRATLTEIAEIVAASEKSGERDDLKKRRESRRSFKASAL